MAFDRDGFKSVRQFRKNRHVTVESSDPSA